MLPFVLRLLIAVVPLVLLVAIGVACAPARQGRENHGR